eukprot:g8134.t1
MKEARRARGGDFLLQRYVENLLEDAAFQRVSHLPIALERKLYYDICRSVLQVLELALTKMHNFDIVGHSVQVEFSLAGFGNVGEGVKEAVCKYTKPRRNWTRVNETRVEMVINQIMQDHKDMRKFDNVFPVVEKQFITTVAQVSMRLLTDLFCDERIKIRVLGHNLRWNAEPMSTDALEKMFQARGSTSYEATPSDGKGGSSCTRSRVNREAITLFVDELLSDEELNLLWVPDVLEAQIYHHALTTVIAMMEDVLSSMDITVLGLQFKFSLVSAMAAVANDSARRSGAGGSGGGGSGTGPGGGVGDEGHLGGRMPPTTGWVPVEPGGSNAQLPQGG